MSQAYRMGFQDIARSSDVSRIFIKTHIIKTATGEEEEDNLRILMAEKEIDWEEEFAMIKSKCPPPIYQGFVCSYQG